MEQRLPRWQLAGLLIGILATLLTVALSTVSSTRYPQW
jgi:hypothetical protein